MKTVNTTSSPIVSVLITVFDRIDYLEHALRGALSQTFSAIEIIVLDDSGQQLAAGVCRDVSSAKVTYIAHQKTLGVATSLKYGIERSRGKYIAILNDDDIWESDFLISLVPPLESDTSRVISFCNHWIMNANGEIDKIKSAATTANFGRSQLAAGDVTDPTALVLLKNGVPLAMAAVFRKAAIDPKLLFSEVSGAYDYWISCLLASGGGKFYFTPKYLTRYRVHEKSETARRRIDKSACQIFIHSKLITIFCTKEWKKLLTARLSDYFFRRGKDELYFHQKNKAMSSFVESIKLN